MATVSIVILSYNHPEIIEKCLRTLKITEGVDYEVVVVDNASDSETVARLHEFMSEGLIDTLVLNDQNHMFSEGNNIGVRNASSDSEYVLLLNSDVAFLRSDWLTKLLEWMESTPEHKPAVWDFHPAQPLPGPRDIVSLGWSYDGSVEPSHCRPEGWCCLIRKSVWEDISTDFPWLYGFEEMIGKIMRKGARCGVLSQYSSYAVHREGGSEASKISAQIVNKRVPDLASWLGGLLVETLDFSLGPHEHDSYLVW